MHQATIINKTGSGKVAVMCTSVLIPLDHQRWLKANQRQNGISFRPLFNVDFISGIDIYKSRKQFGFTSLCQRCSFSTHRRIDHYLSTCNIGEMWNKKNLGKFSGQKSSGNFSPEFSTDIGIANLSRLYLAKVKHGPVEYPQCAKQQASTESPHICCFD